MIDFRTLALKPREDKGTLIVYGGLDGAGKTTQIEMLLDYARSKGVTATVLKQPTQAIRDMKVFRVFNASPGDTVTDYRGLLLFTLGDRILQQSTEIVPRLARGEFVICDRYVFCTMSNVIARGLQAEDWLSGIFSLILRPDLAVYLDVDADTALKRIRSRPEEAHIYVDADHLSAMQTGYRTLAEAGLMKQFDSAHTGPQALFESIKAEIEKRSAAFGSA